MVVELNYPKSVDSPKAKSELMMTSEISKFRLPNLGVGAGFRFENFEQIKACEPDLRVFEIISETYLDPARVSMAQLDYLTDRFELIPHGVSMSLGSTSPPGYIERLKGLVDRVDPPWFSDHLCWTGVDSFRTHQLLPIPCSPELIPSIVDRIKTVQDFVSKPFLIENIATYLSFSTDVMPEWEFLGQIAEDSDCGLVLDLNNIYVNALNHGFDPKEYIESVPADRVVQYHLAGHALELGIYLDSHDRPVSEDVWELYTLALEIIGPATTILEWDSSIPSWSELSVELEKAELKRQKKNAA